MYECLICGGELLALDYDLVCEKKKLMRKYHMSCFNCGDESIMDIPDTRDHGLQKEILKEMLSEPDIYV
ncbi:hypothetical protein [Youngiibacter multivorans]|uniref:Transcription elongation factor Elf1 n=1 Tax=Youngiibacter multivorans TaxID=937251 RepID=A0ABS4G8I8_9CLOT|nr:hypothetical protein [Youngiibacter multivorans]MBP1920846.1 transcription elongation factor Elf1 [Youngiibacter multivorans]